MDIKSSLIPLSRLLTAQISVPQRAPAPGAVASGAPGLTQGGTAESDFLDGSADDDIQNGLAGTDFINGNDGNDTINGGDDSDFLSGGNGADQINGGNGDDVLQGEDGVDAFDGGAGRDEITFAASTAAIAINLATGQIFGDGFGHAETVTNIEVVTGSLFSDLVSLADTGNAAFGGAGDDTINGGASHDVIYGEDGNDLISGGDGNDTVRGQSGDDAVNGGLGDDALDGGQGVDTINGGSGQDLLDFDSDASGIIINLKTGVIANDGFGNAETVSGIESVNAGLTGDDQITLSDISGIANGYGGNDLLVGGNGSDTLFGGDGVDTINGGAGSDWVGFYDDIIGVQVNLKLGTVANDGSGNAETISDVENVLGTALDDQITLSDVAGMALGNGGNDILLGGNGADTLAGGEGDDLLLGGAGNDRLDAGLGSKDSASYQLAVVGVVAELWRGTASNDGQGGSDVLVGVEGLIGSNFNDLLAGNESGNLLDGQSGNDSIYAGGGADTLQGGFGNDLLAGGEGSDTIDGGAGIDSADFTGALTGITAEIWRGEAYNTNRQAVDVLIDIENLIGSGLGDVLGGSEAANVLSGMAGDDGLYGGGGNDSLNGGVGNDILEGGGGADFLIGGAGNDTLDGGTGIDAADFSLATAAVVVEIWRGTASNDGQGGADVLRSIENLVGSNFNDLLSGNESDNRIDGMNGNDSIFAGGGIDTVNGGAGNDFIAGNGGDDVLDGGTGFDTVDYSSSTGAVAVELWRNIARAEGTGSTGGIDTLQNFEAVSGSAFNDLLVGNELANLLQGAGGDDQLYGGGGADTLQGGANNDLLAGGQGNDVIDGGAGTDTADYSAATAAVTAEIWRGTAANDGQGGNDTLLGIENLVTGNFNDLLGGNEVANLLSGLAGNDSIFAGGGNDTLIGGIGNDLLFGNAGQDSFRFDGAPFLGHIDTLGDFVVADDTIELVGAQFVPLTTPGVLAAGFLRIGAGATTAADADDYLIYNSTNGFLYFDADGNGAATAVQIAVLPVGLALTNADFVVV